MILALDVGGTFIKWAVADGYELLKQGKIPTPQESFETFAEGIQKIFDANKEYDFEGMAISYPGMEDPKTGLLVPFGALAFGLNQPMKKMLEERFRLPVSFENDGRLAALAEAELGTLKGIESGYVLVIGTGIGGAFVRNGKVENGYHGYGGQISLYLVDDIRKQKLNPIFSAHNGMPGFLAHAAKELGEKDISGETFMAMVKEGHPKAAMLLEEYMDAFTNVLFSLQMLLDPQRFVIGGGISADTLFMETMQRKYEEIYKMFGIEVAHADIVSCKYRNTSNIMGALVLYHKEHPEQ